jgi:hypothetical protein
MAYGDGKNNDFAPELVELLSRNENKAVGLYTAEKIMTN